MDTTSKEGYTSSESEDDHKKQNGEIDYIKNLLFVHPHSPISQLLESSQKDEVEELLINISQKLTTKIKDVFPTYSPDMIKAFKKNALSQFVKILDRLNINSTNINFDQLNDLTSRQLEIFDKFLEIKTQESLPTIDPFLESINDFDNVIEILLTKHSSEENSVQSFQKNQKNILLLLSVLNQGEYAQSLSKKFNTQSTLTFFRIIKQIRQTIKSTDDFSLFTKYLHNLSHHYDADRMYSYLEQISTGLNHDNNMSNLCRHFLHESKTEDNNKPSSEDINLEDINLEDINLEDILNLYKSLDDYLHRIKDQTEGKTTLTRNILNDYITDYVAIPFMIKKSDSVAFFIKNLPLFSQHNLPLGFFIEYSNQFYEVYKQKKTILDLSKEGIFIFPSEVHEHLIDYSIIHINEDPILATYINQAFNTPSISKEVKNELYESIRSKLFECFDNISVHKHLLVDIINKIDIPSKIYDIVDNQIAQTLNQDNFRMKIPFLGEDLIEQKFPYTYQKLHEFLGSTLSTNEDIADYFFENLSKYSNKSWTKNYLSLATNHKSVAAKLIKDKEKWLDQAWIVDLINHLEQQIDFEGKELFKQSNPYKDHEHILTPRHKKLATYLYRLMQNRDHQIIDDLNKHFNGLTEIYLITELHDEVIRSITELKRNLYKYPEISEEDKQAIIDPTKFPLRMLDLENKVTLLLAYYLSYLLSGEIDNIRPIASDFGKSESFRREVGNLLKEGINKFIEALKVDVPLYDKLYQELDHLREYDRRPLEVYIGRDGVYAHIGRRAQDVARRRAMGLKNRQNAKKEGEYFSIRPKYLVYPRYFRDNLSHIVTKRYLQQERITQENDPIFYDTGYTGTIPEQIMRIMGFSDIEIEERIKLLSATKENRLIKGISHDTRIDVVGKIEYNSKPEYSAEGLYEDKQGQLKPIARPTAPKEQFLFAMVKEAIARHYYLKEYLETKKKEQKQNETDVKELVKVA